MSPPRNKNDALLGTAALRWLLRVEAGFAGKSGEEEKQAKTARWLWTVVIAILLVVYYAFHFFIIDSRSWTHLLSFSSVLDMITVVTLYSVVFCSPLTVSLGLDHHNSNATIITDSIKIMGTDSTTKWIGIGNCISFLLMVSGDIIFFILIGWKKTPSFVITILYALASIASNGALGLASGYVALAHNVFAIQLQALAHRLDQGSTRNDRNTDTAYGAVDETEHLVSCISIQQQAALTPQTLGLAHIEFRRRQDVLAIGLHRRVALLLLTVGTQLIIMVKNGYQEYGNKLTGWQLAGILGMFFGTSFSLWSMVFTMGRVMFLSREECGYSAMKWAHTQKQLPDAMETAVIMSHYPIRFHAGIFELNEEVVKAVTLTLVGLAGVFVGVHLPEL